MAVIWFVSLVSVGAPQDRNLDDMYIVLVYARHLARDGALYWNRTDPPVDGFTSLFDVWTKALGFVLHVDPFEFAFSIGMLFYVLAAMLAGTLARRIAIAGGFTQGAGRVAGSLTALSVAGSMTFGHGASFFLESQAYASFVLAAVGFLLFPRFSRRALLLWGAILLGCGLTRPEGVAIALATYGIFVLQFVRRLRRARLVIPAIPFLGGVGTYVVWHRLRFGFFAPNTFYAKRSDSLRYELVDGLAYLGAFIKTYAGATIVGLLVVASLLAMLLPRLNRRMRRRLLAPALIGIFAIVLTVWEGGDCYKGSRFFVIPAVLSPVCAATIACVLLRGGPGPRSPWPYVAAALAAVVIELLPLAKEVHFSPAQASHSYHAQLARRPLPAGQAACDREWISTLAAALPPNARLAESDAQRIKYWADGATVLDLHGLNNRNIAHGPAPGPVRFGKNKLRTALEERPEAWVIGIAVKFFHAPPRLSVAEAIDAGAAPWLKSSAPRIEKDYVAVAVPGCGGYVLVLARRDVAESLRAAGIIVGPRTEDHAAGMPHD